MLGLKTRQTLTAVFVATTLAIPAGHLAFAESMSSDNYKITSDVLSQGGGNSESDSYKANDAIGELATGEDLASDNYKACAGFECAFGTNFITFSVSAGTSSPGVVGDPIPLGTLSPSSVTTSDGSTVRSVFITAEGNPSGGIVVTVADANGGLASPSAGHTIPSSTATLANGVEGFGVCVFSTNQNDLSPTTLNKVSPYNSTCTKTTGHSVGLVSPTAAHILSSSGYLLGGEAEILVKSSISGTTLPGSDYADTLTFIATGTY